MPHAQRVRPRVWTSPRKHGRAPLPVGTSPALVKGTASVELTGRAKEATAAKPEALEPRAYGEAGRKREMSPRGDAGHQVDTPPQYGERRARYATPRTPAQTRGAVETG
jgi:hypothetical protein